MQNADDKISTMTTEDETQMTADFSNPDDKVIEHDEH